MTAMKDQQQYRDWTITMDQGPCQWMAYPTAQGIDHDYDQEGDRTTYCGNCLWNNDVEGLKADIDDVIISDQAHQIKVLKTALENSQAAMKGIRSALSQIVVFEGIDSQIKQNEQALKQLES